MLKILFLIVALSVAEAKEYIQKCEILLGAAQQASELDVGTPVHINVGASMPLEAYFLGLYVDVDETVQGVGVYDPKGNNVHIFPMSAVNFSQNGIPVEMPSARKIATSINQSGGTCAAFAINNCLRQMHNDGRRGNGVLAQHLDSERGRTRLLTDAIDNYYVDGNHTDAIVDMTRPYGFQVEQFYVKSAEEFKNAVVAYLKRREPLLVSFKVPRKMWQTPYAVLDHQKQQELDRRLWQPKTLWSISSGGHMVLFLGVVEVENAEPMILVLDSNWRYPRLWPLSALDQYSAADMVAYRVFDPGS